MFVKIKLLLIIWIVIITKLPSIKTLRILGIFPTEAKSHFYVGESIMKGLAKAGHQVTMISAFPQKEPIQNYTDCEISGVLKLAEEEAEAIQILDGLQIPIIKFIPILIEYGDIFINYTLTHPNVRKLMDEAKFDVILVEMFCTEAMLGFGQHFNAPVIAVSSFGATKWTNDLTGNPSPISFVPHTYLNYTDKLSIWQRFINLITNFYESILTDTLQYWSQKAAYNAAFPKSKYTYDEVIRNVSLVLLNTHFSMGFPRPYLPNMIQIGGIQINRELKPLPKDLKDFLDSAANNGAIYFSMGSYIESKNFPNETRQAFLNAFSKLKQKIIWKFEDETLSTEIPSNVLIKNWMPQNDILAHPNIKLFITHGGLLGLTEAVYHGVPIIGIPVYGDQQLNVQRAETLGYGVRLNFRNITEQSISWMINEVLENSKYTKKIKEISSIYRDQPMTPMESVIYWVEYVVRHNGAPHLRSASLDLNFIEYHNIDVFMLMLLIILIDLWILKLLIKRCFNRRKANVNNKTNVKQKRM